MKIERYTPEEIFYMDGGVVTLGNDDVRYLIACTLSKIPKKIAERVMNNCMFVVPMRRYERGFFMPKKYFKNKNVLAFPENLFKWCQKTQDYVVLHEVAHFYLKHQSPLWEDMSDEEAEKQEQEADRLAKKWLSDYSKDTKGAPE